MAGPRSALPRASRDYRVKHGASSQLGEQNGGAISIVGRTRHMEKPRAELSHAYQDLLSGAEGGT